MQEENRTKIDNINCINLITKIYKCLEFSEKMLTKLLISSIIIIAELLKSFNRIIEEYFVKELLS